MVTSRCAARLRLEIRLVVTTMARMADDHAEREQGVDLGHPTPHPVRPVHHQLRTDERQDGREAVTEVDECAERPLQHEVQRAQAEQRERVGHEHQVRVAGDAVHRRHGVDGEDHVGGQDRQRRQRQRGERPPATLDDAHPWAAIAVGDRPQPADELDHPQLAGVDLVLGRVQRVPQHLDRGQQQDGAEQQERPGEVGQHGSAEGDEDPAQEQRPGHADQQDALLQFPRHGERAQQQHEHEQVVHAQRLLDQVARVELQAALRAERRPDPHAESQRQRDVERRPAQCLLHGDLVGLAGDHEVEGEQRQHDGDADRPQLGRTDLDLRAGSVHGNPSQRCL